MVNPLEVDFQNPPSVYPFVGGDDVLIIRVCNDTPLLKVWMLFSCPAALVPIKAPDDKLHPVGLTTCHLVELIADSEKSSKNRNVSSPLLCDVADGLP